MFSFATRCQRGQQLPGVGWGGFSHLEGGGPVRERAWDRQLRTGRLCCSLMGFPCGKEFEGMSSVLAKCSVFDLCIAPVSIGQIIKYFPGRTWPYLQNSNGLDNWCLLRGPPYLIRAIGFSGVKGAQPLTVSGGGCEASSTPGDQAACWFAAEKPVCSFLILCHFWESVLYFLLVLCQPVFSDLTTTAMMLDNSRTAKLLVV